MKKILGLLAILAAIIYFAFFFNPPSFDEGRLSRIDTYMERVIAEGEIVGGLALIAHKGHIVYEREWGDRDREAQLPMTRDTIFRIYSMTKPITAVAVMMLYEEGHFRLDEPIGKYIPELANLKLYDPKGKIDPESGLPVITPQKQPSIEDILAHKGGFTYGLFFPSPVDALYAKKISIVNPDYDLQKMVTDLGQMPLLYEPDTRWHYSLSNDILGRLVETVSGQRFGEFLQQRIFQPLGMKDTSFTIADENRPRFAQLYSPTGAGAQFEQTGFASQPTGSGLEVAPAQVSAVFQPGAKFEGGGGGLLSTARDYYRFYQMMVNGGELDGVRLLAPSTVKLMTSNVLADDIEQNNIIDALGDGTRYGLGFGVITEAALDSYMGENGSFFWGGAAGTMAWADPENELIAIFMTQSLPHISDMRRKFITLTYQALMN